MKDELGMSLVEVMVALVMLATGLLGVAAGADQAERMLMQGQATAVAVERTRARLDSLRGRACATGSGTIRYLHDSTVFAGPWGSRQIVLEGVVVCR